MVNHASSPSPSRTRRSAAPSPAPGTPAANANGRRRSSRSAIGVPAHQRQRHQNPDHDFDEPQPARGHAVARAEELVGQQQVRRGVVVGDDQRDGHPRRPRHGDPRDGVAQVADPLRPAAAGSGRTGRSCSRRRRAGCARRPTASNSSACEPTTSTIATARSATLVSSVAPHHRRGRAGGLQIAQRQPLPIGGQVAERAFQAHRHRHVGQRVAAEVDEAGPRVDRRRRRVAARRRTARAGRASRVGRAVVGRPVARTRVVVGFARRQPRDLVDVEDADRRAAAARTPSAATQSPRRTRRAVGRGHQQQRRRRRCRSRRRPRPRSAASTRCRSMRRP